MRAPSVYFAESDGLIKIGYSMQPHQRVRALRARLLGTYPGDMELERATHRHFADLAIGHEWFRDDGRIRAFVTEHCRLPEPDDDWSADYALFSLEDAAALAKVTPAELMRWVAEEGLSDASFTPRRRTPRFIGYEVRTFRILREFRQAAVA